MSPPLRAPAVPQVQGRALYTRSREIPTGFGQSLGGADGTSKDPARDCLLHGKAPT